MREVLVDEVFEDDASQLHVPIPSRFHDRSHGDSHLDTLEARAEQPLYAHPAPELYTSMPPTALFSPAQSVHFTPAQTVTGSYFDVRGDESDSYQSATPNSMLDNLSLVSPQWISSPLHSPSAHSTGQFAAALASAAPPEIVEPTELSALHVARDRTRSDARSRPYPPPSPVSIASAELDHISIPARDPAPRPPRRGGGRPRTNTAASRENGGRAAREFVYTEERARQFALNDAHIFAVYTRSLDNPKVVISSAQVEELRLIDNDATTMLGQAFRQRQRYEIQRDAIGQLYHFMDKDGAPWQAVVVERRGRKEMDVHAVPGASGSRRATAPPAPETLYHFALFQPQEVTVQPAYKIGDPEWWRIQVSAVLLSPRDCRPDVRCRSAPENITATCQATVHGQHDTTGLQRLRAAANRLLDGRQGCANTLARAPSAGSSARSSALWRALPEHSARSGMSDALLLGREHRLLVVAAGEGRRSCLRHVSTARRTRTSTFTSQPWTSGGSIEPARAREEPARDHQYPSQQLTYRASVPARSVSNNVGISVACHAFVIRHQFVPIACLHSSMSPSPTSKLVTAGRNASAPRSSTWTSS